MLPFTLEAEVTEDGTLHVDLPPEAPRGRVVLTLVPQLVDDLDLTDEDLRGHGLTAEEIAGSPEIGSWAESPEILDGATYVENLRRPRQHSQW